MAKKGSILVVDDEEVMRDVLDSLLTAEGYEVELARNGEEGLDKFQQRAFDLVLLDVFLPGGMNGIEVLRRIRSINPTVKVIMVTGNTDPLLAREALELGALAYVDKPFDFDYLKRVVAMALR